MATAAVLTAPVPVSLSLTVQGQRALMSALGPKCATNASLSALKLGTTSAGPDILIQQAGCKSIRFIAVPTWGSVQSRDPEG